ncbi:MAG: hypothetical protein ABIQ93_03220 [Saprospiraceae bacterium]
MFQQNVTLSPGTGTFTSHTFEILIMLLGAFLLGLWLGYAVWARYKEMADQLRLENMSNLATIETMRTEATAARNRISVLETDATNFNAQIASLNRNNTNMRDRIAELESELTAASAHIRQLETELGLSHEPDLPAAIEIPLEIMATGDDYPAAELQEPEPESVVEILVETPVEEPPAILNIEPLPIETRPQEVTVTIPEMTFNVPIAGTNLIRPETMGTMATVEPDNKEALAPAVVGLAGESDDLTVIEGIGPKIQMLLNQYGIYTYRQLADTDVARMKDILAAAGPQLAMHDPGTWPSQANLAANDQWEALKSIQGFLKGGRKPV